MTARPIHNAARPLDNAAAVAPAAVQPVKIARQVIEVVGPQIDMDKLKTLLSGVFGTSSVKLRTSIPLDAAQAPQRPGLGKLGQSIMEKLSDAKPWRSKHLIQEVAEGRRSATIRHELDLLLEEGRIQRPRSGIYMLAGLPLPKPDDIRPLRDDKHSAGHVTPAGQRVLDLLDGPTNAKKLEDELGLTRQRIDQLLKLLLKSKLVQRVPEPGMPGRWLWMRSEANVRESLRSHVPTLPDGQEGVLAALEPDAFHSVSAVASVTDQSKVAVAGCVRALESRGLVVSVKLGKQRYVSVAPRGLEHPIREPNAKRAVIANLSKAFGEKRIAFIETLAALGEAKTIDITAALTGGEGQGRSLMAGQMVSQLLGSDFAETVPKNTIGQPSYRLTEVGKLAAALIARDRKPPSKEALEARIQAFKDQRTARLRENGSRLSDKTAPGIASPAQQAIVDALREGNLATTELQKVIEPFVSNTRSVNLMLKTLASRGIVKCTGSVKTTGGRAKVWAIA